MASQRFLIKLSCYYLEIFTHGKVTHQSICSETTNIGSDLFVLKRVCIRVSTFFILRYNISKSIDRTAAISEPININCWKVESTYFSSRDFL